MGFTFKKPGMQRTSIGICLQEPIAKQNQKAISLIDRRLSYKIWIRPAKIQLNISFFMLIFFNCRETRINIKKQRNVFMCSSSRPIRLIG